MKCLEFIFYIKFFNLIPILLKNLLKKCRSRAFLLIFDAFWIKFTRNLRKRRLLANSVHPDVKTNTSLHLFQALHERLHSRILGLNNVESPSEDALLQEQNVVDVQRPETVGRVQVREERNIVHLLLSKHRLEVKVYSTVSLIR